MGFAACWHVPLPFCMRFSTCEHVRHIIMPTPRDLIHFGMATSTTSSCHPQAFKRRLVRKNASCGRWSWLAFTPSCSPTSSCQPQCIYELGFKYEIYKKAGGGIGGRAQRLPRKQNESTSSHMQCCCQLSRESSFAKIATCQPQLM